MFYCAKLNRNSETSKYLSLFSMSVKKKAVTLQPKLVNYVKMKRGLVLEGGAMRGLFTCGIIDVMMEAGIEPDGIIGVSAGAAFGCNYKSRQPGRAIRYNKRFAHDKRFCSWLSWLKTGNLYNAEFGYHIIPTKYDIFDNQTFDSNPMDFYAVCTDVETGKPVYKKLAKATPETYDWIRASASMPLVSKVVELEGKKVLDGGVADSIPLAYFEHIGFERNVVILTQPEGYVKEHNPLMPLMRIALREYPQMIEAMDKRHLMYNQELEYVRQAESEGRCLVIRPKEKLPIGHISHDSDEMQRVYDIGVETGRRYLDELIRFYKPDNIVLNMSNIKIELAGETNVGLVRQNNEDNYMITSLEDYGALMTVADGMGGANAGEVASAIAIETIKRIYTPDRLKGMERNDSNILTFMEEAIKEANLNINNRSKTDESTRGMGTTIVMAWIINDKAYVCWCGDSRCYVLNQRNRLIQLSKDHSLVQELVDKGQLEPELMHDHPLSNVITRCLGNAGEASIDTKIYQLQDGDIIMLCSDGLCGVCPDDIILKTMTSSQEHLMECKNQLIDIALSAGGFDNITITLAKVSFQTK